jgi:anti-sigma factor RsiW
MMSNCAAIDPLITPYIDRELPDRDRQIVDQHLGACPPCHARVTAETAMRRLVQSRQSDLQCTAPAALHTRCAAIAARTGRSAPLDRPSLPPSAIPLPRTWRSRLAPLSLAASLVVVVGGAFLYQATHRSARVMAAELTADHVKCFAMNAALGTHERPSSVESTMLSSFDWRMHLPAEPAREGLELVGARLCLYGEGKIAHIMYRHEGRPLSLFMLPNSQRAQDLIEVLGHEAAIWCVNNRTFVLVARESPPQMQHLATFVRSGLH